MEVMIDLETLGVGDLPAIGVIAAIKFSRHWKNIDFNSVDKFYCRVDWENSGHRIEPETKAWWTQQSNNDEIFENKNRVPIEIALRRFQRWVNGMIWVWSNGSIFDIRILEQYFKHYNLRVPWKFWNIRDTRTIYDIGRIKLKEIPNPRPHHALYDCMCQIIGVLSAMRKIEVNDFELINNEWLLGNKEIDFESEQ